MRLCMTHLGRNEADQLIEKVYSQAVTDNIPAIHQIDADKVLSEDESEGGPAHAIVGTDLV